MYEAISGGSPLACPTPWAVSRLGSSKGKVCASALGLICTRSHCRSWSNGQVSSGGLTAVPHPPSLPYPVPPLLDSKVSGSLRGEVRYKADPVPGVKTSQKPTLPSVISHVDLSAPATQVTYFQVPHSLGLSTRPLQQTRHGLRLWGAQDLPQEEQQRCKEG